MKCHFCKAETNMTVRNSSNEIILCCKECKERENGPTDPNTGLRKMELWIHLVTI